MPGANGASRFGRNGERFATPPSCLARAGDSCVCPYHTLSQPGGYDRGMRLFRTWVPREAEALEALNRARQLGFPAGVMEDAQRAVEIVRRDGDAGVIRLVRKYDRVSLTARTLRVPP